MKKVFARTVFVSLICAVYCGGPISTPSESAPPSSSSVSTTTPPPPTDPPTCVLEWKPFGENLASLPDGVSIGQYKDGSEVYVGRVTYDSQMLLGRINLTPAKYGIYVSYGGAERYVTSEIEYLSKTPICQCSFETCDQCTSVPNVFELYTPDLPPPFWISKETVTYACGDSTCSFTALGRVLNQDYHSVWYADENGIEISRQDGVYDVLTCA